MSKTGSQIRDNFIYTVRVVSAKQSIQIEHHVTVKIHIVEFLFIIGTVVKRIKLYNELIANAI